MATVTLKNVPEELVAPAPRRAAAAHRCLPPPRENRFAGGLDPRRLRWEAYFRPMHFAQTSRSLPSSMSCLRWRTVSLRQTSSIDEAKTLAVLVRPS